MKTTKFLVGFLLAMMTVGAMAQNAPVVTITTPTNGVTYVAPVNITLRAEASDTNGIAATQIFGDSNLLGSVQTNVLSIVWTNVPVGTHVIRSEAQNNFNVTGTSAPVTISVISNTVPSVSITATDTHAAEPGDDTGTFNVTRSGDVSRDLTVSYSMSGTASNGVDFVTLPGSVTIPAGSTNATLVIQPIDDAKVELTEAITLVLRTNSAYRLLSPTTASVYIYDNETNHPPTVQMVYPHDGDSFADPTNIVLTAEALDVDDSVPVVSFYKNGVSFAAGIKNPTNNIFTAVWTNVPAGTFSLTALARDAVNQGLVTTSAPVSITVTRTNQGPFVSITAPTNGKVFTNSSSITLAAFASTGDASRIVKQVEFFLGTTLFGAVTNSGTTSGSFYLVWSNAPAGSYVVTSRATDDGGNSNVSAPVTFSVVTNQIVSITATDINAFEPGTDTGLFTISRAGSVAESLTVNYRISGTASNGVDYSFLPGSVIIPAGASNATVVVQPIDDTLVESTETVTLTLVTSNTVSGTAGAATVYIYDNEVNQAPTVTIVNPTNASTFNLPTNILLQAEAHDSDGYVSTVSFYRGTNWIGSASVNTASPALFSVLWTNPPAGDFSITARAYDNFQKGATSAPVAVSITSKTISNALPVVSIYSPTNGSKFTAPTNIEVTALASESNGVIATVQFFANDVSLGIVTNNPASAQPANIFHLTWANPLPGTYYLSAKATDTNGGSSVSSRVSITIVSNTPPNLPPTVSIDTPTNFSVFYGPTNISITAQAADSDGQVARVYFLNGSLVVGTATNTPYSVVWSNVAPGSYSIVAKAVDNLGASSSSTVSITVKSIRDFSFVTRSLPMWYVPGVKLTVKLLAYPKTNTTSYAVQDFPPAGWTINSVGENGTIDTGGSSVSFGQFNDKLARTFTYMVTPPANESGEKHFSGYGTANGVTSPVLGVTAIIAARPHPADINPTNFFIGTNELDAYTLAWKRCERWLVSPSPVPLNYLTRAGYIVRGGGSYNVSSNYPTPLPPLIWVRDSSSVDSTSATLTNNVPWTTSSYGSAISSMPTNYFSNVTFTVTINISPVASCSAYAVEDRPPEGWVVSNVSDGGFYCPILKKVKWGLFLDNQARALSYQITPTTNLLQTATFSGVASFDGINIPITGKRSTYFNAGSVPPAKLQSIITSPSGDRIITFLGQPGVVYRLEASATLSDWTPMESLLNNDGVLYYSDPATANGDNKFYRAVPTDGN